MAHDDAREALSRCTLGLNGLGHQVMGVFRSKERDFLDLGERLQDFSSQARSVSEATVELAGLTSGENITAVMDSLAIHLTQTSQLCEQSGQEQALGELLAIMAIDHKLSQAMGDFSRLVKRLSMLGVATRIESSRLGSDGMGFSTLADDVEALAGKIVSASNTIVKRAKELSDFTQSAHDRTSSVLTVQRSCSLAVVQGLEGDISQLGSLTANSTAAARELADKAQEVLRNVSQAVLSMQIHDIIRQQLEHVDEALEQAQELDPDQAGEDFMDVLAWVYDMVGLQLSQLDNARERFGQAVDDLLASLRAIGGEVSDMTRAVADLSGERGGAESGVLASIKSHIGAVAQALRDFVNLGRSVSEVMVGVGSAIGDMAASVSEIEEVGEEIELIAINASIKAAHTGDEGKALGVLATAIQKLSLEARGQTDTVAGILAEMEAASAALRQSAENFAQSSKAESVITALQDLLDQLIGLNDNVHAQLAAVNRQGRALGEDIRRSADSVTFHLDIVDALAKGRDQLEKMAQILKPHVPQGHHAFSSTRLTNLMSRYTMEAERLVHEGLTALPGQSAPAEFTGGQPMDPAGDMGDNVELF